ncbi:MAG: SPOR domain-containing protein, partial [Bacteroidia bacterium]|nr:SPOR domain-containing protein [Bacteroidia bacterium]MDW8333771.1 SPOR domain-containing protein [Bacteroidia bacterium]
GVVGSVSSKTESSTTTGSDHVQPTMRKTETATTTSESVIKPTTGGAKSYHLVVESASSKENAERAVKSWAQKGLSARILPNPATGGYRISVFSASDRAAVEAKKKTLVETQKIGSSAWIFSE